jgi:hypothetical protein
MQECHCPERASAEENKACVEAKDGCITELNDRADECWRDRRMWVCQSVLVEMVDVCDAKVKRCIEDDVLRRYLSQEM